MIPGLGKVNPRKMQQMMKQMGISMSQLEDVEEVVIRTPTRELVFASPDVLIMDARGVKTYQITGTPEERPRIPGEDVQLVMEQTGKSEEEARKALQESGGDIAQAILNLK